MTSISLTSRMKQHSKTSWMPWVKGYLAWKVSYDPPRYIPGSQDAERCFRYSLSPQFTRFEQVTPRVSLKSIWYRTKKHTRTTFIYNKMSLFWVVCIPQTPGGQIFSPPKVTPHPGPWYSVVALSLIANLWNLAWGSFGSIQIHPNPAGL